MKYGFFAAIGRSLTMLVLAAAMLSPLAAMGAEEVNLYSSRQEFLMRPFLDAFTEETGIEVNVVFAKAGILERLKAEGANSPADAVLTADVSRLQAFADEGLLQPVRSAVLDANIPAQYHGPDGLWYGLTTRARIIYHAIDRVNPDEIATYEDLADPKWRGRVCVRGGKHIYNQGLVASMIAAHGEAKAEEWVRGLVANFARKPQGNDRAQVKAVREGVCDLAIGNSYYYGKMKFNEERPEEQEWAAAVGLIFPNQDGRGSHVNISGMGVTVSAKNKTNAVRLLEFLSAPFAQAMYASRNYEYPVNPAVDWDPEVESWGRFKADGVSLAKIAALSPLAGRVIDRAGWQ